MAATKMDEWAEKLFGRSPEARDALTAEDRQTLTRALRYCVDHDCAVADVAARAGVQFDENGRSL